MQNRKNSDASEKFISKARKRALANTRLARRLEPPREPLTTALSQLHEPGAQDVTIFNFTVA